MPIHTLSRSRRYAINDYGAATPEILGPNRYASLQAWWKADALGQANGTPVTLWNSSIGSYSAAPGLAPTYNSSLAAFGNKPAVTFSTSRLVISPALNLTTGGLSGGNWTIAVVMYSTGDGHILGHSTLNLQMRRFRSSVNCISVYNGGNDVQSSTFSSISGQAVVCWYVASSAGTQISFYENKFARGGPTNWTTYPNALDWMGQTQFGGNLPGAIAELCVWSEAFSLPNVSSLFDLYFNIKYPGVFYNP